MQTAHADRQTRARGIVVALYRGKVVEWWRDTVVARWGAGRVARAGREPQGPRAGEGS